jgi:hypothetical protein
MPSRTYYDHQDFQEEMWQHDIVKNVRNRSCSYNVHI